ncbi:MAG: hypothetical protein IJQ57_09090 [Synergistaceae bacterium]|nr:hypothetical protein [Synergistaceae bacterium]
MAIITQQKVKDRNNTLGFLGALATIGGALTTGGTSTLLTGLGTAMGTANSMINGDYSGGGGGGSSGSSDVGGNNLDTLTGWLREMLGKKKDNLGSGSLIKENTDLSTADKQELAKKYANSSWAAWGRNTLNNNNVYPNYFNM